MTTTTVAPPTQRRSTPAVTTGRLTFPNLVRSEWIKFWSLRSSLWTLAITVLAMAGMSFGLSFAAQDMVGGTAGQNETALTVMVFGYSFGQIAVSVLGALIITGEYTTGMIRSTFTADPGRLGAILAKGLVLTVSVFVTGLAATALAALVSMPVLAGSDIAIDWSDSGSWRVLLGTAAYLALIALLAFGFGTILRNSAGAIATTLGVLLVLPLALQIVSQFGQEWAMDASMYLPGAAGERLMMYSPVNPGGEHMVGSLDWWQGGLVLLGYVTVLLSTGMLLIKRRDA